MRSAVPTLSLDGSHTYRLAIVVWVSFAIALSVKTIVSPVIHSTYPVFVAGTKCWWAEKNPYEKADARCEYRYGPAFAVALTPLTKMPLWLGGLVWSWLNLALFLHALRLFKREILPGEWNKNREGLFLILVLIGSVRGFWAAQTNALVFALVALATVAIARKQWWTAAWLLAIPLHVKVWPIAAAMLLAGCWPRQLVGRYFVAVIGVGAIPFLTKPFSIVCTRYADWFHGLFGPMQLRHAYRDAWTLWEKIHPPVDDDLYTTLQLTMAAFAFGLCLRQQQRGIATRQLLTFICGIWAVWQLAFGPGTEQNTFGLIAPLTSWGLIMSFERRERRWLMGTAFVMTTILSNGHVERLVRDAVPLIMGAHPLGVLAFGGWLLWHVYEPEPTTLNLASPAEMPTLRRAA